MKKIIFTLIAGVSMAILAGSAFAKEPRDGMKNLTIEALEQYGRQLYTRGDFEQAARVYEKALGFDAGNMKLRDKLTVISHKGYEVTMPPMPVIPIAPAKVVKVVKQVPVPVKSKTVDLVKPAKTGTSKKAPSITAQACPMAKPQLVAPVVAVAVPPENMDQDLADLQKKISDLRLSLQAKTEQIKALEQQLPQ